MKMLFRTKNKSDSLTAK